MSVEAESTEAPAAAEDAELELDVELWLLAAQRVGYSPVAYPVFSVVVGTMTPLGSSHLGSVAAVTLGTAVLGLLRVWHLRAYAQDLIRKPRLHRWLFRAGALACGFLFSLLSCLALHDFGVAPTSLVSLLVLAGLVSGGTASLAADLQLARLFICVTLFPPALTCLLVGHRIPMAVPLVIVCCFVFYAALARQMQRQASQLLLHARELKCERARLAVAKSKAEAATIAKGAFLATMSHELRTPLNGVIGMTELLHGTALDATQRDYTETLKTAANGLLALINDILDFSKIEAGRLQLEDVPFDPGRLVTDLVKLFKPQATTKSIALVRRVDPDVAPWVTGDPSRLRQVLLNLLSNAVKFTDTGSVTVSLEPDPEDTRRLRFSVEDTGTGIPLHKHAEIFTEFSQVDSSVTRRYGGTGLGLAISHRLAIAMGSGISLTSAPGQGSTFSFSVTLPAAEPPPEALPSSKPIALPRPLRLLVVDDNLVNLKVATRLLDRLGCSFETANNGQEACDMIPSGNYDVVLMDCMMPILDGYSAARRLRAAGIGIPILAMTANCQPEDIARCFESGMNAHLPKPIRLADLAAALTGLEPSARAILAVR